jgi:hypothetical protein
MTTYAITEENIKVGTLFLDSGYGLCLVTGKEEYIGALGIRVLFYTVDYGEYKGAYLNSLLTNYIDEILEVPEG